MQAVTCSCVCLVGHCDQNAALLFTACANRLGMVTAITGSVTQQVLSQHHGAS